MKLTEMKQILDSGQIQLTKSLGQNFLQDQNQVRRIVAAAELAPTDRVLEIGPGLGPLTELLLQKAQWVLAIEKDHRLEDFLRKHFTAATNLELICDDALDYLRRNPRDWSDWKLVANLPYSVASRLLVELVGLPGCPRQMVVTLQREVARRLVAGAGDADYGMLSLLIQLRYQPRGHFKISADCFFPPPDVQSACVILSRREKPLLPDELRAAFSRLVKLSFSQRRKIMVKRLKQDWPVDKLTAAFEQLGLSPQIRAEKVSVEQFAELTKILAAENGP
ncbi:MAG TPA: 16S rRNA (adenine(1518)-N(6)/adenine(1519)-N(6))-dimethyltransferase RsmA [Verrucomicrobiae bacterium]|nr:16S rRNA (adenine(1518)-N(6)/adenine(1519)-N(6))-dimethyltransferase RsmA [Verrucomicrobiae bacterium]